MAREWNLSVPGPCAAYTGLEPGATHPWNKCPDRCIGLTMVHPARKNLGPGNQPRQVFQNPTGVQRRPVTTTRDWSLSIHGPYTACTELEPGANLAAAHTPCPYETNLRWTNTWPQPVGTPRYTAASNQGKT